MTDTVLEKARAANPRAAPGEPETPDATLGFAQVAFAGHSRLKSIGSTAAVKAGLTAAWMLLAEAGLQSGRLLSGFARGSDTLAVETWLSAGLGPVQAVFPFLDDDAVERLPDDLAGSAVLLDGKATREAGRSVHLSQARWLIGAADLLVVVWNGRPPRGSGGTADCVRLALEHGIPVLWIHPGDGCALRLVRPEFLFEDCGFLECVEQIASRAEPLVTDATPRRMRAVLGDLDLGDPLGPPSEALSSAEGLAPKRRPLAWPWRAYALLRRTLGGRGHRFDPLPVPSDLAAQSGFRRLTTARAAASEEAKRLGAVHRSQQIILLAFAVGMATVGSASALWPGLNLQTVALELLLGIVALILWRGSARQERHLRWGQARKSAEDLRLERVAWTLGVSTAPHGLTAPHTSAARRARRLAGLPYGAFQPARVKAWGAWVIDELLSGQAAYHRDQSAINGRVSERFHQLENLGFAILLLLQAGFLLSALAAWSRGGQVPHWLAGAAVMAGAIVPAIGAAGLALEATLSFHEQGRRSHVLAGQLDALRAQVRPDWRLDDLQGLARTAIRIERAHEDHWSEDVGRRRLFRGG